LKTKWKVKFLYDLEKLNNLKEMNISYNKFSGLISRKLAVLDTLNMTMLNDKYGGFVKCCDGH
jgi:hypothetical protein